MFTTIAIPVPINSFVDLSNYMDEIRSKAPIAEFAGKAIDSWLVSARMNAKSDLPPRLINGYQWKDLFLPSGTGLRAMFNRTNYHASVEGDQIIFRGTPVSPAQFVIAAGGVGRNPWKVLWLLFPHERTWRSAASSRTLREIEAKP